jgi:integrase
VRTRYRDGDGRTRRVSVRGASRSAAMTELVDYWLADLDLEGRLAPSTRFNYEREMRQTVLPHFEHLTLREIGVARCDALLKELAKKSYARVEGMLGTSARIGEVLAIRRRDLDLTTTPATLRICGTVISERGVGTYRQEHPKTDRSNRIVPLPAFTAEALRRRLATMSDHSLDALVFRSREGTPLTTANVRRQLRRVLGAAGIEGVSPYMFRRTVATVINEQASVNLAAELLGHADPKVTIGHYIRRNEQVNPLTAELLDSAFYPATDGPDLGNVPFT